MSNVVQREAGAARRLRIAVFVISSAVLASMIAVMVLPNAAVPLVTEWGGPHTVHESAFTLFGAMVLVGLAAQVRRPRRHAAAMTLVFGFLLLLALGGVVTAFFFPPAWVMLALAVLATATHPGVRRLLTPASAPSRAMLGLAVVAAVPAVIFAVDQLALQRGAPAGDEHAELGHWVAMAAMVVLLPALAALGGLRPAGWRWPAFAAAISAVALGAVSVSWPSHASSLGLGWGLAAVAWGVAVGGVSLAGHRRLGRETDDADPGAIPGAITEVSP